jgi:hypothetical protein
MSKPSKRPAGAVGERFPDTPMSGGNEPEDKMELAKFVMGMVVIGVWGCGTEGASGGIDAEEKWPQRYCEKHPTHAGCPTVASTNVGDCGIDAISGPTDVVVGEVPTWDATLSNDGASTTNCHVEVQLEMAYGGVYYPDGYGEFLTGPVEPGAGDFSFPGSTAIGEKLDYPGAYRWEVCTLSYGPDTWTDTFGIDEDESDRCQTFEFQVAEAPAPTNQGDCGVASITGPTDVTVGDGSTWQVAIANEGDATNCHIEVQLMYDLGGGTLGGGGYGEFYTSPFSGGSTASFSIPGTNGPPEYTGSWVWEVCALSYGYGVWSDTYGVDEDDSDRCQTFAFDRS